MYYLKDSFTWIGPNQLWDRHTDTEYTCEEGWYYVDHGDYFMVEPIMN